MGDSAGFGRVVPRSPRPENGESREDQMLLQVEPDVLGSEISLIGLS